MPHFENIVKLTFFTLTIKVFIPKVSQFLFKISKKINNLLMINEEHLSKSDAELFVKKNCNKKDMGCHSKKLLIEESLIQNRNE